MKTTTNTGKIPNNVGFAKTEGEVKQPTPCKNNERCKDEHGREFLQTDKGRIY